MRFVVQYSPSSRAGCKYGPCKQKIDKDAVRIAKISEAANLGEGVELSQYFHVKCVFDQMMTSKKAIKLSSLDELEGFDQLKPEDQKMVQSLFDKLQATGGAGGGASEGGKRETKKKDQSPSKSKSTKRKSKKEDESEGDHEDDDESEKETPGKKAKKPTKGV